MSETEAEIQGKIYFLAGTTGTGKTTFIEEKLDMITLPKKIFDIDKEFSRFGGTPINEKEPLENQVARFKESVKRIREHAIVFSEAGIFFDHSGGASFDIVMREILKSARRRGNFIFFDFHSLSEIPTKMLKFCNYLVLKKTSMETYAQISKYKHYPELIKKYKAVQRSKNNFATAIIEPRNMEIDWGTDDDD